MDPFSKAVLAAVGALVGGLFSARDLPQTADFWVVRFHHGVFYSAIVALILAIPEFMAKNGKVVRWVHDVVGVNFDVVAYVVVVTLGLMGFINAIAVPLIEACTGHVSRWLVGLVSTCFQLYLVMHILVVELVAAR